jgi:predicted O-methyltransferase YrrM
MRVKEFLYFIILKFKNRSAKIPATDLEITEALYNTNLVTIPNLGKEIKLPPFDIWTLAPDSLIFILNYIKKHNLKSVLELGSGLSTVAIAGIFQQSNFENQVIVSLEQDQKYQDQTTKWLTKNKLTKFTRIINSPLIEYSIQNKKWWW